MYIVYALDTAQTIIVTNDVFNAYAKHFGDSVTLDAVGVEWLAVPILTSIGMLNSVIIFAHTLSPLLHVVSCAVQVYYGFRLKILSRSRVLMIVICVVRANRQFLYASHGRAAGRTHTSHRGAGNWSHIHTSGLDIL